MITVRVAPVHANSAQTRRAIRNPTPSAIVIHPDVDITICASGTILKILQVPVGLECAGELPLHQLDEILKNRKAAVVRRCAGPEMKPTVAQGIQLTVAPPGKLASGRECRRLS